MSSPKLIKTWEELKECTSETHVLMIEVEDGNGWIYRKDVDLIKNTTLSLDTHSMEVCMSIQLKSFKNVDSM